MRAVWTALNVPKIIRPASLLLGCVRHNDDITTQSSFIPSIPSLISKTKQKQYDFPGWSLTLKQDFLGWLYFQQLLRRTKTITSTTTKTKILQIYKLQPDSLLIILKAVPNKSDKQLQNEFGKQSFLFLLLSSTALTLNTFASILNLLATSQGAQWHKFH